ncbi:uncharacterized protein OCT59_023054 [Rhizophagus irregularis]|uniref:uncharacterized protein n=1 Tax=Rhizophagus irregularis TaxID=588596 RepID=UPI0033170CFA|nr:hypothetical protein OCT59_023054 [Rhizophagus irregularis]
MINEVTHVVIMEGREKCQALDNFYKSNQDNNTSLTQHTSDERSQQQQKRYKAGEEVVESLTSEESINVFLARQRLRFVKENLNKQETKNSMFLELNIVAYNIDGIASIPFIQKLHNLLEFIKENGINIMAISETNIDYRQEYFINQDIKSEVYSIIFSEHDQKLKDQEWHL